MNRVPPMTGDEGDRLPAWPETLDARELERRFPGLLDSAGVMGGAANIIMQLARRGVGRGVIESRVDSGKLFRNPMKRARTTFTYLAVAILGTPEEKLAYRKAVNRSHAQVRSTAESPVTYNAFDPELQLWVAACLYWGAADMWERLYGKPDAATADALYRQLSTLGTTLQVRDDMWPADRAAFDAYWQAGLAGIDIDDEVRAYLTALVDLKFLARPLRFLFARFHRFVTTGLLPEPLRAGMQFDWTPEQQRRFDRFMATVAWCNRRLPRVVRQAPVQYVMRDFRRRLREGRRLV